MADIEYPTEIICRKCGVAQPLQQFKVNKECTFGRTKTCRSCDHLRLSPYYKERRTQRRIDQSQKNREMKRKIVDRFGGVCHDCLGIFHPCIYDFHHIDPSQKDININYTMYSRPSQLESELIKCVMLCANCHRLRHFKDLLC